VRRPDHLFLLSIGLLPRTNWEQPVQQSQAHGYDDSQEDQARHQMRIASYQHSIISWVPREAESMTFIHIFRVRDYGVDLSTGTRRFFEETLTIV
jgi:hypothetical protein